MTDLEQQLIDADKAGVRFKLITTDGVFSMDGYIAQLDKICDLAEKYNALVHFDDSHAVGFVGKRGRGTHELCDCMDRVDLTTGTLGKALGGASGGYTSGRKEIVALLRQRSRPYLFSNSVAPPVVAGAIKAIDLLSESTELRDRLEANTRFFRSGIQSIGLTVLEGVHPIVPIMLYDAQKANQYADLMLQKGVYVIAFSFPVVPKGKARIRTQISAAHTTQELQQALDAFAEVKRELGD
jgi:glycine C-acetyltransferase